MKVHSLTITVSADDNLDRVVSFNWNFHDDIKDLALCTERLSEFVERETKSRASALAAQKPLDP